MRDLRKYARQTNTRLILGAIFILFTVGSGLIYVFYGSRAAVMGLICMLSSLAPFILVVFALWVVEEIVKFANKDE